jgi:hypothetical protein
MKNAVATTPEQGALTTGRQSPFQIVPKTIEEAMTFAQMIAKSDLAPKDFKDKPANVLIAMQMGAEVGLSPMASIQNIAVINGRPSIWGDSMLALCQIHPEFEGIDEHFDEHGSAVCTVRRRGYEPHTQVFTLQDVVTGGYANKSGPWQTSKKRMMQMRARAFALRDRFADALRGLCMAEEAMDLEPVKVEVVQPEDRTRSQASKILDKIGAKQEETPPSHSLENEGAHEEGGTNVQAPSDEELFDSCIGGSEEGTGAQGGVLYQGTSDDLFKDMMEKFDSKKNKVSDFIKFYLGEDRLKKWGDLKTLTPEEMTKLHTELQKIPQGGV